MAIDPHNVVIAILWRNADARGLSTEERTVYEKAGRLYQELRRQNVHPVVVVGREPEVKTDHATATNVTLYVRDYLDQSGIISSDHVLYPPTEAYRDEDGTSTAKRHQHRLSEKHQTHVMLHVFKL